MSGLELLLFLLDMLEFMLVSRLVLPCSGVEWYGGGMLKIA